MESGITQIKMSEEVRGRFAAFIETEFGIKMPAIKKTLLEGRLAKRLRALSFSSFDEYCDYLFSASGHEKELPYFSDLVSTHKTDFFREPSHYETLRSKILPEFAARGIGVNRPLDLWSAACSTGEEPYTLAMVLDDYGKSLPAYRYTILGSDISEPALAKALRAVYHEHLTKPIPEMFRKAYLFRGSGDKSHLVRIAPVLRAQVRFRAINLMDEEYAVGSLMDIIFCRNVLIYFDKENQGRIIARLAENLRPGGYLILGHSETILGPHPIMKAVVSTVYQKVQL
ncbi:MAG: CheR family methyltransferase [Spirochaetota bacterium]